MITPTPTTEEQTAFSLRAFKGIEAGLGQADPTVKIARKLEEQHPNHLILVQAGKFLHGFDRTAYALSTLKKYKLKLLGTSAEPHLRIGFPVGNFQRRLWPMLADFGIPYVVALGTQAAGHTIYLSNKPTGNTDVLSEFDPDLKSSLYKKAGESAQGQLIDEPGYLPTLKYPQMSPIKWGWSGAGYESVVNWGVSGKDDISMIQTEIDTFRFDCQDGGTVVISFRIVAHPTPDEIGRLSELVQREITLTLTPPSAEEQLKNDLAAM